MKNEFHFDLDELDKFAFDAILVNVVEADEYDEDEDSENNEEIESEE